MYLAASPAAAGVSGGYFVGCRAVASSGDSYDAVLAGELWGGSAGLVGLGG